MNKKIWVLSIIAAVLMILLPISSVVGTNVIKSNDEKKVNSPLFTIRQQSKNTVNSDYLGKGRSLSLFVEKKMTYASSIDKAIRFLNRNPAFFNKFLEKIQTYPKFVKILKENGIKPSEFDLYANSLKDNPILLEQEIKKVEKFIPEDTTLPLGINSTNPIAIIILIIAILPIILMIGVLIATITIITCLNIGGCFETIMQNMLDSFVQGLTQPTN